MDALQTTIGRAELTDPLARLDDERALLDEIGWSVLEHQQPLEIDFARHGQTIVDALESTSTPSCI